MQPNQPSEMSLRTQLFNSLQEALDKAMANDVKLQWAIQDAIDAGYHAEFSAQVMLYTPREKAEKQAAKTETPATFETLCNASDKRFLETLRIGI